MLLPDTFGTLAALAILPHFLDSEAQIVSGFVITKPAFIETFVIALSTSGADDADVLESAHLDRRRGSRWDRNRGLNECSSSCSRLGECPSRFARPLRMA